MEAVGRLSKALDQLLALPPQLERDRREVALLMQLCPSLIATRGYACPELAAACSARTRSSRTSAARASVRRCCSGSGTTARSGGAFARADVLAVELERLASECPTDQFELQLCIVRGRAFWRGRLLRGARALRTRARAVPQTPGREGETLRFGQDPCVVALSYLACIAVLCGDSARGEQLSSRRSRTRACWCATRTVSCSRSATPAATSQLRGDRAARCAATPAKSSRSAATTASVCGTPTPRLVAWADAIDGDPQARLAALEQGFANWRASGAGLWRSQQLVLLAEVHLLLGQVSEGMQVISNTEVLFQPSGECLLAAELLRLRGELSLRKDPPDAPPLQRPAQGLSDRSHQARC